MAKKKKNDSATMIYENVETAVDDPGRICAVNGTIAYGGVYWRFSLRRVADSRYPLRGRVSVLNPDGKGIMQIQGAARRKKIKSKCGDNVPTAKQRSEWLGIRCILRCNADAAKSAENINRVIERKVKELYTQNVASINQILRQEVTPQTITPVVAFGLHGEEYLNARKKRVKWTEKTYDNYYKQMMTLFCALPLVPMANLDAKTIATVIKHRRPSSTVQRMAHSFWSFCLETGVCRGSNPILQPDKRKSDAKRLQKKTCTQDVLDRTQDEAMYSRLLRRAATDSSATGVALMRYGGFSPKDIYNFCWRNILMDDKDPDLVRIDYRVEDNAGATHDYTRPVMVQAARIIQIRWKKLKEEYKEERLNDLPVVSQLRDPTKKMTVNNLVQLATGYLREAGVSEETLAEKKSHGNAVAKRLMLASYKYDLEHNCGLDREPGTINYLLGRSLVGDVTSDNYTSFSDFTGQWRLYRYLRCTMPDDAVERQEMTVDPEKSIEIYHISPTSMRRRPALQARLILAPKQSIELKHQQGMRGTVKVRGVTADNKPRRLSRQRKFETGKD